MFLLSVWFEPFIEVKLLSVSYCYSRRCSIDIWSWERWPTMAHEGVIEQISRNQRKHGTPLKNISRRLTHCGWLIACGLFVVKPLTKAPLIHHQLDPKERIWMKFYYNSEHKTFQIAWKNVVGKMTSILFRPQCITRNAFLRYSTC